MDESQKDSGTNGLAPSSETPAHESASDNDTPTSLGEVAELPADQRLGTSNEQHADRRTPPEIPADIRKESTSEKPVLPPETPHSTEPPARLTPTPTPTALTPEPTPTEPSRHTRPEPTTSKPVETPTPTRTNRPTPENE